MRYLMMISILFWGLRADAIEGDTYKILQLGDDQGKPGPVRLEAPYVDKQSGDNRTIYLETLTREDIPDLISIRSLPPVYERYATHEKPSQEVVQNWLETKLLPRVGSPESVFPFVLKNENHEVQGLINIGYGYEGHHRMFGVYTNPGRLLSEEDDRFEEWNRGRGLAALQAAGEFMMLWHQAHPSKQHIHHHGQVIKLWGDVFNVLSATSDVDNMSGRLILEKLGMKMISATEIRQRGYAKHVGNKIYYELSDFREFERAKIQRTHND